MTDIPIRERVFSTLSMSANTADQDKQREMQIIQEYSVLKTFQTSGVYILPQFNNIRVWNGVIFIRSGAFMDSILKFRIDIPNEYPNASPSVVFLQEVFHPLVDPETGVLNISPKFPSWKANQDFLFMLVAYIREIFSNRDLWKEDAIANPGAFEACTRDFEGFKTEVKKSTVESYERVFENSPDFSLKFTPFNSFHKKIMELVKIKDATIPDNELYESFMARFKKEFK